MIEGKKTPPPWPVNPDGTPKKIQDLTAEQQMDQARYAVQELQNEGINVTLAEAKDAFGIEEEN